MSEETESWLNTQTLVGMTDKRGNAWHYRAEAQGEESNHYPGAIPSEDVIRRLFNFEVEGKPIYIRVPSTNAVGFKPHEVPGRKAMVRTDTQDVLGIFKDGYQGHSYREWLLENVGKLIGSNGLDIGSAGLLSNGAKAWVSIEVPDTMVTPEGVEYRPHLLATTSYDGTIATTYKRVVQLVVCDNTLSAALGEKGQVFKIRHSKYSGLRIAEAQEALAIVENTAADFQEEVSRLTSWKVEDREFDLLLDAIMPVNEDGLSKKANTMNENRREIILGLYKADSRVAPWKGTAFGVLQAFNTERHHESIVRSKTNRAQKNMLEAINGMGEQKDAQVMKVLAQVAN